MAGRPMLAESFLEQSLRSTFEWYKQADTKAQVVLAFTGVLLNLTVGSVLLKGVGGGTWQAWAWTAVVGLYLLSVALSVEALRSRGIMRRGSRNIYFFGHVANYDCATALRDDIVAAVSEPDPFLEGLSKELLVLSRNTKRKHRLVNVAVLLTGVALTATVALGVVQFHFGPVADQ